MNKSAIIREILHSLREDFESRLRVSKTTRELGNNSESRAEGKYDTLSIEENYLADGLAKHAESAAHAIAIIEKMPLRAFTDTDPIDFGALVEIQFARATEWFFLAPVAGGTEVTYAGTPVTVVTPESPLGKQLLGSHAGGKIKSPAAQILRVL
ncbi:MAG: transcription elongation factor GreAB [Verrucomicrobia bacterium]|nr:transcription elongation factor GreAB [Verrucomicrobiota bacterium]